MRRKGADGTRVSEIAEFDTESLATRTQGRGQLYYYGVLIKTLCVKSNVRRMLSKTEIRSATFGRTRRFPEKRQFELLRARMGQTSKTDR